MPPRLLVIALLTCLLLVPATAEGKSNVRLRGTVAAKDAAAHLVSVKASRQLFSLRVPGSVAAIRAGQRVELRGTTLRAHGQGSRVLARRVAVVASQPLSGAGSSQASDEGDDEIEIKGRLASLAPVTVVSGSRSVSCTAPAGMSLSGLAVGDLVEMTCDLVGGTWVVRKLEQEDDDGPGGQDDDDDDDDDDEDHDDDSSGPGSGDDDEEDDD
jgi:hypothetical protein